MLSVLESIVQAVNHAQNLTEALNILVSRVKKALKVDVVSIYLVKSQPNENQLVLKATIGLNTDYIDKICLSFDQGLVGLVAQRSEIINLATAHKHERFVYFSGSNEEKYNAFLGVPILRKGKVVGVLVIQKTAEVLFSQEIINFAVTLAVQISSAIAHNEVSDTLRLPAIKKTSLKPIYLEGIASSPGIAIGSAILMLWNHKLENIPDKIPDSIEAEIDLFHKAIQQLKGKLNKLGYRLDKSLPDSEKTLLQAYGEILSSDTLVKQIEQNIYSGNWAAGALRQTIDNLCLAFNEMDDIYMRTRAEDLRALGTRLLSYLLPEKQFITSLPENVILVGENIDAAHLAELPLKRIKGIISMSGSSSSHLAILARALNIPAVLAVTDLPIYYLNNLEILVDGYGGAIYIQPDQQVKYSYQKALYEEEQLSKALTSICGLPALTIDGKKISLCINTGLLAELTPQSDYQPDGIGLYRTEVPFLMRETFPSEEEQLQIYEKFLQMFPNKPVIARTLDIGGDKNLSYFQFQEENPFLGWRGIRISLDHPEIFIIQLRALMRSNLSYNNLSVLLPMISSLQEFKQAKDIYIRVYQELLEEKQDITLPPLGILIEVPSAVYQIKALTNEADFISIGTNDLTQYLLAVDRNNQQVAKLYNMLHPALLKALYQIVTEVKKQNKPVSVCGELAGDPIGALFLIGIGLPMLSMNIGNLPKIKWVIRSFSAIEAEKLALYALELEDPEEIKQIFTRAFKEKGLGNIIGLNTLR